MNGYTSLPLVDIHPSPTNPRKHIDPEALDQLAESMRSNGLMQPIVVREVLADGSTAVVDHFEIIAGERRYRAAIQLGWSEIDARVMDADDNTAREMQIVENLQRADISPMEEALAYASLVESGVYQVADLAAKVGRTASYIYGRLRLTKLGEIAQQALANGTLRIAVAAAIANLDSEEAREEVFKFACPEYGRPKTLAEVAEYIREELMHDLSQAPWAGDKRFKMAKKCGTCTKRTGCQTALFADELGPDKDNCLDGECWDLMEEHWRAHLVTVESGLGNPVLSLEESANVLNGKTVHWNCTKEWALLSSKPGWEFSKAAGELPVDLQGKTFGEMMAPANIAKATLAMPVLGKSDEDFVALVNLKELAKGLAAAGLVAHPEAEEEEDELPEDATPEDFAAHQREMKINREAHSIKMELLLETIEKKAPKADQAELLAVILEHGWRGNFSSAKLDELAGQPEEGEEPEEGAEEPTLIGKGYTTTELMAALAYDAAEDSYPGREAIVALLKINPNAIEEKARKAAEARVAELEEAK